MNSLTVVTAVLTVLTSIVAAWTAARKVAGGPAVAKALESALREEREVRTGVVLVALDGVLDKAAELRTMLVRRGFKAVRCQDAETYKPGGEVFVFLAFDGRGPAGAALESITRAGQSSGLIYTPPGFRAPAGDWTFANSPVTLYARLRELIAFNRAAESN